MHAENFLVNKSCNWKTVEHVGENFPEFDSVSSLALIVEPINAVDLGALVITSKQEEVLGILDFVAQKKTDCFNALLSSVDVVTQEQVVSFRREAAVLKKTKQVVVLPMHIA